MLLMNIFIKLSEQFFDHRIWLRCESEFLKYEVVNDIDRSKSERDINLSNHFDSDILGDAEDKNLQIIKISEKKPEQFYEKTYHYFNQ